MFSVREFTHFVRQVPALSSSLPVQLVNPDSSAPVTGRQMILVENMELAIQHVGFELFDHLFIHKWWFEFDYMDILLEERI